MICFEVRRNGERLCLAGIDGHCVLTAHVTFVDVVDPGPRRRRMLELRAGGMESESRAHVDWVHSQILVGDRIEIVVMEAESADPPKRRSGPMKRKELIDDAMGRIRARRKALLSELKDLDRNEAAYVKESGSFEKKRQQAASSRRKKKPSARR